MHKQTHARAIRSCLSGSTILANTGSMRHEQDLSILLISDLVIKTKLIITK